MPNGQGGDGLHTCTHCGAELHGGGHGGADFCNTSGCPGNYSGGVDKPQRVLHPTHVREVHEHPWYEIQVGPKTNNQWLQIRNGTLTMVNGGLSGVTTLHVVAEPEEIRAAVNALVDAATRS